MGGIATTQSASRIALAVAGCPILRALCEEWDDERSTHPRRSCRCLSSLPYPNQRIVISTEAAHAFCEQRSGEIRFSTEALPEAIHSIVFTITAIYFCHFQPKKRMSSPKTT